MTVYILAKGPCWIADRVKDGKIERAHFATLTKADTFGITSHNVPEGKTELYLSEQDIPPYEDSDYESNGND